MKHESFVHGRGGSFFKRLYLNNLYRKFIIFSAIVLSVAFFSYTFNPQLSESLTSPFSSPFLDSESESDLPQSQRQKLKDDRNNKLETVQENDDVSTVYEIANETLGFQKLLYLNTKTGHNVGDLITLQSIISGIRPTEFLGVSIDDLNEKGLAPAQYPKKLKQDSKASYRSHANLWQKIIQENWETVFVLSPDATWDMDIKKMMFHFSQGLEDLMRQEGLLAEDEHFSAEDPYLHKHWDILQLGTCYPKETNKDKSLQYYDPFVPDNVTYFGTQVDENRRIVRHRSEEKCVTAYAISKAGALKLLLTSDVDMSKPIDVVIRDMVANKDIDSFSVYPVLFAKWTYKKDLLPRPKEEQQKFEALPEEEQEKEKGRIEEVWRVSKSKFVSWEYFAGNKDSEFKRGALWNLSEFFKPRTKPELEQL